MISRATRNFWKHYDALPQEVQRQAVRSYALWRADPSHRSLQFKCVSEKHAVFSVRVAIHWRALGYRDVELGEHSLTWFWIGSHADYDKLQRFPVEWNRRAITISPLSSPAKAGDPVTPGAAEYWIPRFRGE